MGEGASGEGFWEQPQNEEKKITTTTTMSCSSSTSSILLLLLLSSAVVARPTPLPPECLPLSSAPSVGQALEEGFLHLNNLGKETAAKERERASCCHVLKQNLNRLCSKGLPRNLIKVLLFFVKNSWRQEKCPV